MTAAAGGLAITTDDDERLETPKQLAARVGLTERQVRHLIQTQQLAHLFVGCRVHIPVGAFGRYLAANMVKPQWRDETKAPDFAGSTSAGAITSPGPKMVAAASARLARQTAKKLKTASRNGSMPEDAVLAPRDPAQILVTDVLNDYLVERGPKVAASDRIAYAVLALTDFFEGNTVADVTPQTCDRYAAYRGRSVGTVRRELGVLRAAINHAHRSGRITRPVAVELPDRPEARDRWLTRKEAAALIRAARTPQARLYMPLFILLGIYTGRRKEAILSLRWPQVDLHAARIDFEVAGRRRTNKKRGKVPIPPRLLPHLRRARKRGSDMGYVLHIDGERIGDIKKGFASACGRAGLQNVIPHTLRHTCATWLMQSGIDPWQASGFLSMSMETLQRVYGHHHPDHMRAAADAISRRPQIVRVTA